MHVAGSTTCLFSLLPFWLEHGNHPEFHQWDLLWPCGQVLSSGYRTKGGKRKGCRHSHPLLIFILLSEVRWKQMPATSFEGPNGKLEGDSTWVRGGEPGSLLDSPTQRAYQSAALNHCIAVENGPREIAGEWCFLCTFSISVGPTDGVDGAVEMKTLPCPSAPSVCSLTPMWIKGQCVYTSEGTWTPLQCMSCSHFNLAFSSVQWCSCVNSFTCLTP